MSDDIRSAATLAGVLLSCGALALMMMAQKANLPYNDFAVFAGAALVGVAITLWSAEEYR